ncbi:aquaporin [Aestuariivirga litoralis]|uniref:aquaporin n=1 Tax=Aestuariivirga litoralis TaxID=2650924 RepID=UPI0018C71655|nr:MIP/aquaporin family protein [Aestuariivirga litoralis]MBG1230837.1 aquaporin family protein [Aestuariivirga litoralis]
MRQYRDLLAEFVGTTLLLATVIGSGIMGEQLAGGNTALALLGNTIATGAILYVLITVLGPISGAHFNPVVSFAVCATKRLPWPRFLPYVAAQVIGALVGVWLAHAMFDLPLLEISTKQRWGTGQWVAEATATFGLLLAIFGGIRFNAAAIPALVGFYITAAYWFTASTSFANPAVTMARALSNTFAGIAPDSVLPFIAAQAVGTACGLLVCSVLFFKEEKA